MSQLVVRNTAINILQFVYTAIVIFVMTPIYVRVLGDYDYGIWQILAALLGYAQIFDLGFQPTVSRFVARFSGRRQRSRLPILIGTSLAIVTALSMIPALAFSGWGLLGGVGPESGDADGTKYRLVLFLVALAVPLGFITQILVSVVEGMQAYYARTSINIVGSLIFVGGFILLHAEFDPLLLMSALTLTTLCFKIAALTTFTTRIAAETIQMFPFRISKRLARRLAKFGSKSLSLGIAATLVNRVDTLLVGAYFGPAKVVFYTLPQTLAVYIQTLNNTISHAFMPALSSIDESRNSGALRRLTLGGSQLSVGTVLPFGLAVAAFGEPFLVLWVGERYAVEASVLIPLLVARFLVPMCTPIVGRYFVAIDAHGFLAKIAWVRLVLTVGISVALVGPFGLVGVALGALIPELILRPFVFLRQCRLLGLTSFGYLRDLSQPLIFPTLTFATMLLLVRMNFELTDWWSLFLGAAACGLAYLGVFGPVAYRNLRSARTSNLAGGDGAPSTTR